MSSLDINVTHSRPLAPRLGPQRPLDPGELLGEGVDIRSRGSSVPATPRAESHAGVGADDRHANWPR